MTLPLYQLDAFAETPFSGNPAAVVPLSAWPDDGLLLRIAQENNLSETAFILPGGSSGADYHIRWFTPAVEVNLCGHATLAAAAALYECLGFQGPELVLDSLSGHLRVSVNDGLYTLDFPSWKPEPVADLPDALAASLGNPAILGLYRHRDLIVEMADEAAVRDCRPDFGLMKQHFHHIIITARGSRADFVSRFFGPGSGIEEDPVTGSAHSQLIPFWSERLGKTTLHASQLSARGGELYCRQLNAERVAIGGRCRLYLKGEIFI